jgi:2-methylisocitrate lyase-like PEP mutase family enzyme
VRGCWSTWASWLSLRPAQVSRGRLAVPTTRRLAAKSSRTSRAESGGHAPVNADFEAGLADDPDGVAESVSLAIATGVAGLSIEDRNVAGAGLYDTATSLERLKAARSAIDQSGEDVILVARTEGLLFDPTALKLAIEKLVAFADAGADCLYAPGVRDADAIAQIVRAVAPKPLNVVMMRPGLSLAVDQPQGRVPDEAVPPPPPTWSMGTRGTGQ